MDRIDLHTHSTASDGGLRAVALTDHDTTVGLTEAQQAANEIGIELVHGVELATWLDKTEFHIVGLDINENNPHFQTAMARMQQIREDRNNQMVARMQAAGVDISLEKLHAKEGIGVLTRANFAGYLLSVGFVNTLVTGSHFIFPAPKLLRKKPSNSSNRLTESLFSPIRCSISSAKTPLRNMSR